MKRAILFTCRYLVIMICALLSTGTSYASHLYGADFFYTHSSGNYYTITLVIYGDCNINTSPPSAFLTLQNASPEVDIYNGSSLYTSVNLDIQSPSTGVEVTPVCPSQLSNTSCVSTTGTIPGVKKFTYSKLVNLGSTSSNWKFRFDGQLGTNAVAGRSNSITNISFSTPTVSSVTALEATLNNSSAPNSSPVYTTIPTPFFCINKSANYNPGTVDPNNDNLTFSLIAGLEPGSPGVVSYLTGYSATSPIAAATGTFNFSNATGQLAFTPNQTQRSLVVNKVEEYRNGVLVGTSMREMTFVVLNNCNNNPPGGGITNPFNGTVSANGIVFTACKSAGTITFNINPTDLDGNGINITATGIPAGASFNVTNNNSTAPSGAFSWNLATATPGTYNFFITYTDDGCPLSSKQTQAYSVVVLPIPNFSFSMISAATCIKKAVFSVTPSNSASPYIFRVYQGAALVHTINNVTGTQLDSLNPGTYTLRLTGSTNCFKDTTITIAPPPVIIPAVSLVQPLCNGGTNGSITITASGGLAPFQYAIGTGTYSSSNTFTGLAAGSHTLHIKDANNCVKDTTVLLTEPVALSANITFDAPRCNYFASGSITVNAVNGTSPYQYALGTGSFSTTNTWTGLYSGSYTFHIQDANGCLKDTIFTLVDSISVHATPTITHVLCNSDSTGTITLNAYGTVAPYYYKLGSGTLGSTNTFPNLPAGSYNFHVEDDQHCYLDTTVSITEPTPITSTSAVSNALCFGSSDGTVTITAAGGVSPYTYAMGTGAFASTNSFTGLAAGNYSLHIKDANGCLDDTAITVIEPTILRISNVVISNAKCNGSADGSFTITATGGTTPYQYAAGTGTFGSNNVLGGLTAGTYTLHVKDANGCTKDTTLTLTEPTAIIPAALVRQSTCITLSDGKVTLSATGGTPGYQYAVGTGTYSNSPNFTSLGASLYIFHIRDNNNCVKDTAIAIYDSTVVSSIVTKNDAVCFDSSNGRITIAASGGTSPYTYSLGTGPYVTNNVFNTVHAATYVVNVKDQYGCKKDTTIVIQEPTRIVPSVTFNNISCNGFNDGIVNVTATGGTPTYTFARGTSAFTATSTFVNLTAGTYTFRVKDINSCTLDTTISLTEPGPLFITGVQVTEIKCHGDSSGQVIMNGSGGTTPYSYRIDFNAFQGSNTLTGIKAGTHILRLRDNNSCFKDTTIHFTQPPALLITEIHITDPTCEGFTDGRVTLQGAGASSPYQYGVDNSNYSTNNNIIGLREGSYVFHIRDAKGCIKDTSLTLTGYPHIVINQALPNDVSCFGFENGMITVDATGGMQPLLYSVNGSTPSNNIIFDKLKQGTHTVTIIDSKNCRKDTAIAIGSPAQLLVKAISTANDCEGLDAEAKVVAEVSGGTAPYRYAWSGSESLTDSIIYGLRNGNYLVRVTDANDCTDSTAATVNYNNCCKPFIPDAFTPNNDGTNDRIKVLYKGDMKLITFMIFNRFGQMVFSSNNLTDSWDGNFNGKPQDLGVYNYYMRAVCGNRGTEEVEFKGTITLIR